MFNSHQEQLVSRIATILLPTVDQFARAMYNELPAESKEAKNVAMGGAELRGEFVGQDGLINKKFDDENWGNNCSIVHRLLQGPERHGDVQGTMLEYYLSDRYFIKCSEWLRSMTPEVLREIERQCHVLWYLSLPT
jgi:hypothetical protein